MDIQLYNKTIAKSVAASSDKIAKSLLESKIQLLTIEKTDKEGKVISFDIVP